MGVTFSVVFQSAVPPYGRLGGDHKGLAGAYETLDALADANGLRTLQSFLSQDPDDVADLMDMDATAMGLPHEQWFAAADGVAAVQALLRHLRQYPQGVAKSDALAKELEGIEAELAEGARRGVEFHFALVM